MDKSDVVGKKQEESGVKKSETSEDGGKVNKKLTCRTLSFKCYY